MKSVCHSEEFKLNHPVEEVFSLFTPEGEKLWAPGWDYENIMGTTELSEDYIFTTRTHDHGTSEAIWIVKKYDVASHFIQYYKIEPGDKIGVITVSCSEINLQVTNIEVTYQYIPLSKEGQEFISGFTKDIYREFIHEWESLLMSYFQSI